MGRTGRSERWAWLALTGLIGCADDATPTRERACDDPARAAECTAPPVVTWVPIAAGTLVMGTDAPLIHDNARPPHPTQVAAFDIAQSEVTVRQYAACVEAGACSAPHPDVRPGCTWGDPALLDHPVNCVTWHQARAFAAWVGGRLPSEAEWALAARGAEGRTYPWGEDAPTCARATFAGCTAESTTAACALLDGHSPEGVCDLTGNVWEWVEDCWHDDYRGALGDGRPWDVDCDAPARVHRGGAFNSALARLPAADRSRNDPAYVSPRLGFRPARDRP